MTARCCWRPIIGKALGEPPGHPQRAAPDNGLEVVYKSASFNDRMLGHGEPVRVREGERVLFRLLNASPTENVSVALPGHKFNVVSLDGNPVPSPQPVETVFLAPAERVDAIVEMNRPGVWVLGSVKDEDRDMGLGIVIEYANQHGEPQWSAPSNPGWDYTRFGAARALSSPTSGSNLLSRRCQVVAVAITAGPSTVSHGRTNPLFTTQTGKRYRLVLTNKSGDNHPVHIHRHTFEVTKVGDRATGGLMKDTSIWGASAA